MSDEDRIAEALRRIERLRRPPCWGPNGNGDMMVDMEVEAYEGDLNFIEAALMGEVGDRER